MEVKVSEELERFLDFIKAAEEQLDVAAASQQEADAETQDILHSLELDAHSYHETAALGKKLAEVRRTRRKSKDAVCSLEPVVKWAQENGAAIKCLQKCLGEVRKVERNAQNRFYTPRTTILGDQR